MIIRGKSEMTSKSKGKFHGEDLPKPVWELLLVRQLQIILGEKLFGPQARLRITPIAWFEPATSMTSLALVAQDDSNTSQRSYQLCALALIRFVYNGE